jgi:arylsulfatase A-like enzyme
MVGVRMSAIGLELYVMGRSRSGMAKVTRFFVGAAALAAVAYLLAAVLGDSGAERPQIVVRARLGGEPPVVAVAGDATVRKLAISTSTRNAVTLRGAQTLEVRVPEAATHLRFSVAPGSAEGGGVRVVVVGPDGARKELGKIDVPPGAPKWNDVEIELDSFSSSDASLIFEPLGTTAVTGELHVGSVLFLGTRLEGSTCGASVCPARLPNIVIISLDTLGARMLGRKVNEQSLSPFLDELRTEGADFEQAFVHYPNTIASHASLFTSLYPRHHQVYGGLRSMLRLRTLAEHLAAAGYLTAAFTEDAYVGSAFGFDRGFDSYHDGDHEAALAFGGDAAVTFVRTRDWLAERKTDAPVFLFVHTYEVHSPYIPRDEESWAVTRALMPGYNGPYVKGFHHPLDEFAHNAGTKPMAPETVEYLKALHMGEIQYLDRTVKALFSILEKQLPSRATLIVVTSDHGEEFGEAGRIGHGETLTDNVLHVPLVFLWPGTVSKSRTDTSVMSVDIAPTIVDLAGLAAMEQIDGRSFARYLRGEDASPAERPVIAELATAFSDCYRAKLPEDCNCDRVAVRSNGFKLLDSRVPNETRLFRISGETEVEVREEDHQQEAQVLREALSAFRSLAPRQPAQESANPPVDKATEERLRALGYL